MKSSCKYLTCTQTLAYFHSLKMSDPTGPPPAEQPTLYPPLTDADPQSQQETQQEPQEKPQQEPQEQPPEQPPVQVSLLDPFKKIKRQSMFNRCTYSFHSSHCLPSSPCSCSDNCGGYPATYCHSCCVQKCTCHYN